LPNSNQPLRRVLSGKRRAEPGALRSQARRWERRRQASRSRRLPWPSRARSWTPCWGEVQRQALGSWPGHPGHPGPGAGCRGEELGRHLSAAGPFLPYPIQPYRSAPPARPGPSWEVLAPCWRSSPPGCDVPG